MTIKKVKARGKTRHQVAYRDPGCRNTRTKTFDTYAEAEMFVGQMASIRAGVMEMPRAKVSNMTLSVFGAEYRDKYMAVELEATTRQSYATVWNRHVAPRLGHLPLSAIDVEAVQRFKADMSMDGVGDPTQRKALAVLSSVLTHAVDWGRIQSNPVRAVKKPPRARKHKVEPMPDNVVESLLERLSAPDRLFVAFLAYAGMRPGEVLALRGSDVSGGVITVNKAIALGDEKNTKTRKDRVIPVMDALAPHATDLPAGLIFPRKDGHVWKDHDYRNWRRRVFKPAVATLGDEWRKFRPYDMRHTLASTLLMDDWSLPETAEVMGHSIQTLVDHYAHIIASRRWAKLATSKPTT